MSDPRIAPVEDNLESFARAVASSDLLTQGSETDVVTYHLDRPFPLFNMVSGARFAPGTVEERAREVIAPYLERGLPFMWWTTPSSHAEELTPLLTELGLAMEPVPGMYVALDGPVDPRLPDGVTIEPVDASRLDDLLPVFLDGYGIPRDFAPEFAILFEALFGTGDLVHVVAFVDGLPVAGGSAWVTGATAGLYNISTLEVWRGRGLGYAVTAALLNLSGEHGCTHAVLHASEMGLPVYERLGFVEVCRVPQFVWVPTEAEADAEPATAVGRPS
jgi:GNAT superfamily N-acetyltransferase